MKEALVWTIPRFSEITDLRLKSDEFSYYGMLCSVVIYPKGNTESDGTISIYLQNEMENDTDEIFCSITLEAQVAKRKSLVHEVCHILPSKKGFGWPNFLSLESLHDPSNGYLVGDTMKLKVHMEAPKVVIGEKMWEFREEKLSADVTITTSTDSLVAHALVLMAASPVFKAMQTIEMKETQTKCIDMKEFTRVGVEQFLKYVYTLELPSKGPVLDVAQLWAMGDKYLAPGLVETVEGLLKDHITLTNVIAVFLDADAFEATPVRDACLAVIAKNGAALEEEIGKAP